METPILEIKNLQAAYEGKTVLHDVNLTVYQHDFLGIIGPSGGGKTTLIKCILGLLKPKEGTIMPHPLQPEHASLTMGYLPQYNMIDRKFPITVEEVILSGLSSQKSLTSRFTAEHRRKAEETILDEPSTYIDKRFEARLYELLAEINKECAIILVSHDIGTILQQVKSVACVNETLDYHPSTQCVTGEWLEYHFNCPIELLGHGSLPHRILGSHTH